MTRPFDDGLIGVLRRRPGLTRATALVVVVAFGSLIAAPTVMAARDESRRQALERSLRPSMQQALAHGLGEARQQLQRLRAQLELPPARRDQHALRGARAALQDLRARLQRLHGDMLARFRAISGQLTRAGVAATIHARHEAAQRRYVDRMETLLERLGRLEPKAPGAAARVQRAGADVAREALHLLEAHGRARTRPAFDPDDLPVKGLHRKAGEGARPKTTVNEFVAAGLTDRPRPRLAAHGTFPLDGLAGATDPAWRAATPEVTLSEPIEEHAAALDHDPVAIHAWVRNNVQWIPTWGAMQSAEHTLSSRRGNAMDIAGLEIALLRASDIPARYVHGTVEVAADRFRNWAGGFETIAAAADHAASGGIPIATVVEAGRIARIRMEHVWVEAAVDYFPSRAGVNRSADAWIPLDASFKQYDDIDGIDVATVTGLDPSGLAQRFVDSGTIDEQGGFVQGLDPTILADAQAEAQAALEDYIANELPDDATVADVLGGRRIVAQDYETLPTSIPNTLVVAGARYDALPQALQHRLTVGLGTDLFGQPTNAVSFPWAAVNGQRVTLSFSPATAADEEALLALLPEGEITDPSQLPGSIPSYLVRLVPELRLDGEVVATGGAMRPGEELDFAFTVEQRGYGTDTSVSPVIAGSYLHVAVAGGSVSPARLQGLQAKVEDTKAKLESGDAQQLASLTREDLLGDLFHAGGLAYFGQFDALGSLQMRQQGGRQSLAPSAGTYGYQPETVYLFGLPDSIQPGGVHMDLDRIASVIGADPGASTTDRQRHVQLGALSSALEHAVPEQMFSTPTEPAEAVSAVKALGIANAEGQRIYRITPNNRAAVLPEIHHRPETLAEIRAALDAGRVVTTHTDPIAVPGWSGAGYVILDPETGDGAWRIRGGTSGAFLMFVEELSKAIIWSIATFVGLFKPFIEGFTRMAAGLTFSISVIDIVLNSSLNTVQKIATILVNLLAGIAAVKLSFLIFTSALLFSAPIAAIFLLAGGLVLISAIALLLKFAIIWQLGNWIRPRADNRYVAHTGGFDDRSAVSEAA